MGDSAGGYLTAMAAFDNDKSLDVGAYLDCSSEVKAAVCGIRRQILLSL